MSAVVRMLRLCVVSFRALMGVATVSWAHIGSAKLARIGALAMRFCLCVACIFFPFIRTSIMYVFMFSARVLERLQDEKLGQTRGPADLRQRLAGVQGIPPRKSVPTTVLSVGTVVALRPSTMSATPSATATARSQISCCRHCDSRSLARTTCSWKAPW